MQVAISNERQCYSMITEKQQQKNITCVWYLVYFVSTSYRHIRCDEIVLLQITLDCRQGVRENFMKGQGVRVRIKVKNHCYSSIHRLNLHWEMDKTFSPSYSPSQITSVEAEAVGFSRFRFHRKRIASTATASSFRFHIPGSNAW